MDALRFRLAVVSYCNYCWKRIIVTVNGALEVIRTIDLLAAMVVYTSKCNSAFRLDYHTFQPQRRNRCPNRCCQLVDQCCHFTRVFRWNRKDHSHILRPRCSQSLTIGGLQGRLRPSRSRWINFTRYPFHVSHEPLTVILVPNKGTPVYSSHRLRFLSDNIRYQSVANIVQVRSKDRFSRHISWISVYFWGNLPCNPIEYAVIKYWHAHRLLP